MTRAPFLIITNSVMVGARPQPCARRDCAYNLSIPLTRVDVSNNTVQILTVATRGGSVNGGWMHLLCAIDQANEELARGYDVMTDALRVLRGEEA